MLSYRSALYIVLTFHAPVVVVFLEDRKGLWDVTYFQLWSHCVITLLLDGWLSSPEIRKVVGKFIDVSVACFMGWGR